MSTNSHLLILCFEANPEHVYFLFLVSESETKTSVYDIAAHVMEVIKIVGIPL